MNGWVKAYGGKEVRALIRDEHNVALLLWMIAVSTNWHNYTDAQGLAPGEAELTCDMVGMTRSEYAWAKKCLETRELATFKVVGHRTIARLLNSRIFEVVLEPGNATKKGDFSPKNNVLSTCSQRAEHSHITITNTNENDHKSETVSDSKNDTCEGIQNQAAISCASNVQDTTNSRQNHGQSTCFPYISTDTDKDVNTSETRVSRAGKKGPKKSNGEKLNVIKTEHAQLFFDWVECYREQFDEEYPVKCPRSWKAARDLLRMASREEVMQVAVKCWARIAQGDTTFDIQQARTLYGLANRWVPIRAAANAPARGKQTTGPAPVGDFTGVTQGSQPNPFD